MMTKEGEYLRELVHETTGHETPPTYDSLYPSVANSSQGSDSAASTVIYTPPPSEIYTPSEASVNSPPQSPHPDSAVLAAALSFSNRPPPADHPNSLPAPIAIPQLTKSPVTPFARAWAPILAAYDVTVAEFLGFIDNLNVVVTAGTGNERAAVFLAEANKAFFRPRGLHAEICAHNGLLDALRDGAAAAALVAPLEGLDIAAEPSASEAERRLGALRGLVAELELQGLPAPRGESVLLARLCAEQARGGGKWERRLAKETRRAVEKEAEGGTVSHKAERRLDRLEGKTQREAGREARRADREALKEVVRAEKERVKEIVRAGNESHKELSRLAKEQAKMHVACAKHNIKNAGDGKGLNGTQSDSEAFWLVVWGVQPG